MPQLYSLGGKLVSKEEYEKANGINQEVKKEVVVPNKKVKKEEPKVEVKVEPKPEA